MRASYCARLGLAAALLFLPLGLRAADGDAEILFRFPVGGVVTTGPVIDGGRAWFISDSRTLYVITVDGKAIGKRSISSRRAPFIACDPYGRAVIPDGARGILMVNKAGQEAWRRELGSAPFGPPSFGPDGRL